MHAKTYMPHKSGRHQQQSGNYQQKSGRQAPNDEGMGDFTKMGSRLLAGFAGNSGQMVCTPSMSSTFELFAFWFLQHWRQL